MPPFYPMTSKNPLFLVLRERITKENADRIKKENAEYLNRPRDQGVDGQGKTIDVSSSDTVDTLTDLDSIDFDDAEQGHHTMTVEITGGYNSGGQRPAAPTPATSRSEVGEENSPNRQSRSCAGQAMARQTSPCHLVP